MKGSECNKFKKKHGRKINRGHELLIPTSLNYEKIFNDKCPLHTYLPIQIEMYSPPIKSDGNIFLITSMYTLYL